MLQLKSKLFRKQKECATVRHLSERVRKNERGREGDIKIDQWILRSTIILSIMPIYI